MNTNEIVGIGVMILCGVVLVVQILGLLLSIFKKMTTPNVEKLKTRRDKKALIKALRYKDKDVRYAAAEALGRLRWKPAKDETAGWYWMAKRDWDKCVALGALAVEPLSAALKDEEWDVRQAAARALGKIKDPRAVKPLIAALKDEKWDVRQAAAEALGEIGAPAVEPLIAALKGENKDVRQAAAAMLGRLGWQPGRDETAGWYWMVKGDWDKCVALGALAVEPLIAALKDGSFSVRKAAAEALGKIGDPRAVEPLIAALKDKDEYVRKAAAYALGKIKDPRAVEPLIAALKDQNSDVRAAAAYALGEIKDPRAVEPLIAALGDEKSSGVRKAAAAKALGKIKDPRAVEPLIAALKDKDSDVRKAAAEALDHLGWKPAQDESAAWYWATKGKWNACVDIGAPAVQPLITTLGSTNDPYTRRDVAQALVKLYQKSSISQEDREQILAVRNHLIRIHDDQPHIDEFKDCCTNQPHTDIELGVEFPL
jgi:HEAT repeat protein